MGYCIFANFHIDSVERFQRMKDSYDSFKSSDIDEVVMNIRGQFANEAKSYIEQNFQGDIFISTTESPKGWFFDSRNLYSKIKSNVIFFWIEDHICLDDSDKINLIVDEFEKAGIDYLEYSWFSSELSLLISKSITSHSTQNLLHFQLDSVSNDLKNKCYQELLGRFPYLVSCAAFYSRNFFETILFSNHPLLPRWPIYTPFDFEKRWDDLYLLPFKIGFLKGELFAAIDDDNMFAGSSLIARGLYPQRVLRNEVSALTTSISDDKSNNLVFATAKFKFITILKRLSYLIEKMKASIF
jgi:hypothetical protein